MNEYTISIFLDDSDLGIEEQVETFTFSNPYDAARVYDLTFTFSALMNSEKYSQSKNHTGELEVILSKNGNVIRSKVLFLDEDPEKKDARATKAISF